jgi:hypothetical protein
LGDPLLRCASLGDRPIASHRSLPHMAGHIQALVSKKGLNPLKNFQHQIKKKLFTKNPKG